MRSVTGFAQRLGVLVARRDSQRPFARMSLNRRRPQRLHDLERLNAHMLRDIGMYRGPR